MKLICFVQAMVTRSVMLASFVKYSVKNKKPKPIHHLWPLPMCVFSLLSLCSLCISLCNLHHVLYKISHEIVLHKLDV